MIHNVIHALTTPLRAIKAIHAYIVAQRSQRDALIRVVAALKAEDAAIRKAFIELAEIASEIQRENEV